MFRILTVWIWCVHLILLSSVHYVSDQEFRISLTVCNHESLFPCLDFHFIFILSDLFSFFFFSSIFYISQLLLLSQAKSSSSKVKIHWSIEIMSMYQVSNDAKRNYHFSHYCSNSDREIDSWFTLWNGWLLNICTDLRRAVPRRKFKNCIDIDGLWKDKLVKNCRARNKSIFAVCLNHSQKVLFGNAFMFNLLSSWRFWPWASKLGNVPPRFISVHYWIIEQPFIQKWLQLKYHG